MGCGAVGVRSVATDTSFLAGDLGAVATGAEVSDDCARPSGVPGPMGASCSLPGQSDREGGDALLDRASAHDGGSASGPRDRAINASASGPQDRATTASAFGPHDRAIAVSALGQLDRASAKGVVHGHFDRTSMMSQGQKILPCDGDSVHGQLDRASNSVALGPQDRASPAHVRRSDESPGLRNRAHAGAASSDLSTQTARAIPGSGHPDAPSTSVGAGCGSSAAPTDGRSSCLLDAAVPPFMDEVLPTGSALLPALRRRVLHCGRLASLEQQRHDFEVNRLALYWLEQLSLTSVHCVLYWRYHDGAVAYVFGSALAALEYHLQLAGEASFTLAFDKGACELVVRHSYHPAFEPFRFSKHTGPVSEEVAYALCLSPPPAPACLMDLPVEANAQAMAAAPSAVEAAMSRVSALRMEAKAFFPGREHKHESARKLRSRQRLSPDRRLRRHLLAHPERVHEPPTEEEKAYSNGESSDGDASSSEESETGGCSTAVSSEVALWLGEVLSSVVLLFELEACAPTSNAVFCTDLESRSLGFETSQDIGVSSVAAKAPDALAPAAPAGKSIFSSEEDCSREVAVWLRELLDTVVESAPADGRASPPRSSTELGDVCAGSAASLASRVTGMVDTCEAGLSLLVNAPASATVDMGASEAVAGSSSLAAYDEPEDWEVNPAFERFCAAKEQLVKHSMAASGNEKAPMAPHSKACSHGAAAQCEQGLGCGAVGLATDSTAASGNGKAPMAPHSEACSHGAAAQCEQGLGCSAVGVRSVVDAGASSLPEVGLQSSPSLHTQGGGGVASPGGPQGRGGGRMGHALYARGRYFGGAPPQSIQLQA